MRVSAATNIAMATGIPTKRTSRVSVATLSDSRSSAWVRSETLSVSIVRR